MDCRVAARSGTPRPGPAIKRHHQGKPSEEVFIASAEQCGETFYRTKIGLDGAALVIRLLKRRPLREGRRCGRPRPERPS